MTPGETDSAVPATHADVPGWSIGDIRVWRIDETHFSLPIATLIPPAQPEALDPHRAAIASSHLAADDDHTGFMKKFDVREGM
jgi:hypothetical protein